MKLNKGIQRRTIVYFTVTTLLMILATTMITVDLPRALNNRNWRNAPGNVTIGTVTTHWQHFSINPANNDERHAITLARDENGEATVKGMPMELFVYGVGEDFQFPEHYGFTVSKIMRLTSYCLNLILLIGFIGILVCTIRGFRNGIYFSRLQVVLLRWLALLTFLVYMANELCLKFHMMGIGELYGKTSDIKLYTLVQIEMKEIIIPFLLLLFAEIINIAMHLNKEESMTI